MGKLICINPSGPTTTEFRTNRHVKLGKMHTHHRMSSDLTQVNTSKSRRRSGLARCFHQFWFGNDVTIGHCKRAGGYTLKRLVAHIFLPCQWACLKKNALLSRHNVTAKD